MMHKQQLMDLEDVCNNATVALFVMDARQHCIYMNPAAEQMTGYTLAEVQGAPLHDFVHHTRPDGSHYPLAECPIDLAAPANMQEQGEEVFVHRDGTLYPVTFTASPVRRGGAVVGTVVEVQDAGARRKQEREREALYGIALLILQELDHEKIVQAVTDTATTLSGAQFGAFFYSVRNEDGQPYTLYAISGVPREHFSQFPLPRDTHLFGPTFRGDATIRSDDIRRDPRYGRTAPHHGMPPGHLPVTSYLAVPVRLGNGEVIGGMLFGHERPGVFLEEHERLVETLAAQAAIGLNKASLYQDAVFARRRAEQDARDKQRLYEQAERANQAKDQFLATVSHELRTPLTSILGWSQMLGAGNLESSMAQRAIAIIERNARAQAQIVDDLLDISRIVSGKLRLNVQLMAPKAALEAGVEAVRSSAAAKGVALDVLADAQAGPVFGDPERVQQIVWNLVSNAVKFTPRGGRVHVALQRSQAWAHIVVTDTGEGIAPEFLPFIFDHFTQQDSSSSRRHGGLGLGLAIVRKLVSLHGGTVEAHSDGPGCGASFSVSLPLAPPAAATAAANAAPPLPSALQEYGLEQVSVLLVEDDEDTRDMLTAVLAGAGVRVAAAGSAERALACWDAQRPDLIVSDIGMPGMDGYGLIAEVRRRERQGGMPSAPAVALTAYVRVEDRMRTLTSGFQMHVPKPVGPAELLTVLSTLRGWRAT